MKLTRDIIRNLIKEEIQKEGFTRVLSEAEDIDVGGGVVITQNVNRDFVKKRGEEITQQHLTGDEHQLAARLREAAPKVSDILKRDIKPEDLIPLALHNGIFYITIGSAWNKWLAIGAAGPGHTSFRKKETPKYGGAPFS
jgi:hypothetical protein